MVVDYRIIKTGISTQEFGFHEVHVTESINFIAVIDGIDCEVTLSWLKTLMQNDSDKLESELNIIISELKSDVLSYVKEHGYKMEKLYDFDYDTDICVCAVCNK